jgi:hypothetical protein
MEAEPGPPMTGRHGFREFPTPSPLCSLCSLPLSQEGTILG